MQSLKRTHWSSHNSLSACVRRAVYGAPTLATPPLAGWISAACGHNQAEDKPTQTTSAGNDIQAELTSTCSVTVTTDACHRHTQLPSIVTADIRLFHRLSAHLSLSYFLIHPSSCAT